MNIFKMYDMKCVFFCIQVVPWSPVWATGRENAHCSRRARDLLGQSVAVQTWRLCPVRFDRREEQNGREEGFPHQDNVPGGRFLLYVCFSDT